MHPAIAALSMWPGPASPRSHPLPAKIISDSRTIFERWSNLHKAASHGPLASVFGSKSPTRLHEDPEEEVVKKIAEFIRGKDAD
jgi:hypothetical protein